MAQQRQPQQQPPANQGGQPAGPKPEIIPLAPEWRDAPMVGEGHPRLDGAAKVRGAAPYAYEYKGPGEAAYGWMVEATIAKGRITAIDTAAAERSPGVLKVLTHLNAPPQSGPHPRVAQNRFARPEPYLFQPEVRWYGEPVALVLAETLEAARAGAALVKVDYAPAAADLEFDRALPKAYKPANKINAGAEPDQAKGDFAKGFAAAPVTVDETYVTPHEHNMPMEPHATIAEWREGKLTVWSPQQILMACKATLAQTFKLEPSAIRVVSPFIGGGFGAKVPTHCQAILAALGAKALGRPVKLAQTRQQMFANTNHRPYTRQRIRLGATREGRLLAVGHEVFIQTTPHDEFIEQTATFSRGLYEAPDRLSTSRGVILDLPSGDIMRAPGEQPGSFALESAMDELAARLGMDPVRLRVMNEPKVDPESGKPFSSRGLVACLEQGAERFGWARRPAAPGALRDGEWDVGFGVGCATFPAYVRPASVSVELKLDGTAVGRADMTDIGTGSWTSLAQILAAELGLPLAKVKMELGDSDYPATSGSGGSFGMTSTGAGIHVACNDLRRQIAEKVAADANSPLQGANGPVRLTDGRVVMGERSQPLADFLRRSAPQRLKARGGQGGLPQELPFSAHSFGAQFVELGVNRVTSEVRLRRMLGVFAAGRIINDKLARSQILGGMIMGAGAGLTEETIVDARWGQFVNRDFAEYHIPVHADIKSMDVLFIEEREAESNPLGTKGLGEVGIVGVSAAIANAVFNATGVRVRDCPVTLDRVIAGRSAA